jgi:hypothetical protein
MVSLAPFTDLVSRKKARNYRRGRRYGARGQRIFRAPEGAGNAPGLSRQETVRAATLLPRKREYVTGSLHTKFIKVVPYYWCVHFFLTLHVLTPVDLLINGATFVWQLGFNFETSVVFSNNPLK